MQIKDLMTKAVDVISVDQTIREAAKMMKEQDCGSIPVEENDKLIGMVTDRDIALWIASSDSTTDPATAKISECMNPGVKYCFEDANVEDVIENMADLKIRRMPIMDSDKKLVGIVSIGDIASQMNTNSKLEKALQQISN